MSDELLNTARLREVRRRQFLLLWAGSLSVGLCVLALAALLFSFATPDSPLRPGLAAILSFSVVLAGSALLALMRMPTWKATARLVDQTIGLQQRLETAWERRDAKGKIDRLLIEDANRRLMHVRAADVVPIRLDRTCSLTLTVGFVALTALGIVRLLGGAGSWGSHARRATSTVATAPSPADPAHKPATPKTQTRKTSQSPGPAASNPNPQFGTPSAADKAARMENRMPSESLQPSGQPPATSRPDQGEGAAQVRAAGAEVPQRSGAAPASADQAPAAASFKSPGRPIVGSSEKPPVSQPGAQSLRTSTAAASIRPVDSKSVQSAASASSSSAGKAGGSALPGGGVGRGLSREALGKADTAFLARNERDYRAFLLAAEQAISRQKIPPGFRKYIADYFKAIHP